MYSHYGEHISALTEYAQRARAASSTRG